MGNLRSTALLAGLLVIGLFTVPIQAKYGGGTGEPNDPYLVYDANQMNTIGLNQGDWGKCFKLMADIDLGEYEGQQFNIIGANSSNPFRGIFDGNGQGISNFAYSSAASGYVGLFGYVSGENAEIKNLTLIEPNVDAGSGDYVGCLVGRLSNGTVANCSAQGGSIAGFNYVGGLIGYAYSTTVEGCSATVGALGRDYVGGLAGFCANGTIKNCDAAGAVAGYRYVGGLAGGVSGAVTNSYATGSVWAETHVGGLIGYSYSYATVNNSYATGPVVGVKYAGGLVGDNSRPVTNCYATGDVLGDECAGGLVGRNTATVTNCYSTGAVWRSSSGGSGGLVGCGTSSNVKNSFWNTETNGLLTSAGGTGKDTAALQTQTTFTNAGWDFVGETANGSEDIWRLCNQGCEYPKLAWQYLPGDFLCPDYVDFLDFAHLGHWWLSPDPSAADLTGDGFINAEDLVVESHNWLMGMAPGRAGNPDPPNFAKQAPWYTDLTWSPAPFAQSYDVYFGPVNPPAFVTNQAATTFWPETMEYQTSYFWRIDGVSSWGKTAGPLWTFTTGSPAQAANPYPFDNQVNVGFDTGLRWDAGSEAVSHDIYFGTTDPPPFLRNQSGASFYPGWLTFGTRYYWRINEVSAGGTTRGVVWSFTTSVPIGRCFPADTVVWADGRLVRIVDVVPGQKVGRADGLAEVECIQEHGVGAYDCYDVVFESGNSIVVVHSHHFLTVSGEWAAVENLNSGSRLQSLNGPIGVRSVVKRAMPFVGNGYNLKIRGADVFFVGKDGVAAVDCSKLPGE